MNIGKTWEEIKDQVQFKVSTRVEEWGEQYVVLLDDGQVLSSGDIRKYEKSILTSPIYCYRPIKDQPICYRAFLDALENAESRALSLRKIFSFLVLKS